MVQRPGEGEGRRVALAHRGGIVVPALQREGSDAAGDGSGQGRRGPILAVDGERRDIVASPVAGHIEGEQPGTWRHGAAGLEDRVPSGEIEVEHEPSALNLRSFVEGRYKITLYQGHEYGELYDLESDPDEVYNLWDDPAAAELRHSLMLRYIWAELAKEPMWMPRVSRA